ncbi:MAG: glycosyltransferase [Ruegeria sp.]
MKIIHIITNTNVGGAQIMLERYLSALAPQDIDNHCVISVMENGQLAEKIRSHGVELLTLNLRSKVGAPAAVAKLRSIIRSRQPDIVFGWMYHACLMAWAGIFGMSTSRPSLILGIHHSLQNPKNENFSTQALLRVLAAVSPQADLITYCSQVSREQHELFGFSSHSGEFVPNGVDLDQFFRRPGAHAHLAALCDIPETRLIVGNIARNHPMKDHVSMIEALALVLDRGYDVQAVIIGEGHKDGPASDRARALGISDRLTIMELRNDIAELVSGLDVFLLSSAWGEAFPLAVTEAMASGVPCVVTDVGDCANLVGNTGLVVPPNDPEAQAQAVCELLELGSSNRRSLGDEARQRVKEEYSITRYVDFYQRVYNNVTNVGRAARKLPS